MACETRHLPVILLLNNSLSLSFSPSLPLSQDGITCIGFQDTQEKDRFLHQIDRVVKLQQERSLKLRDRSDSGAATGTAKRKPTELVTAMVH